MPLEKPWAPVNNKDPDTGEEVVLNSHPFVVNFRYPNSADFEYETKLVRINLDKEKLDDLYSGKGFIISKPKNIKKDLKDINGIFSPKFGQKLSDMNPYADRYRCLCGRTTHRVHRGEICPYCGWPVKFVGDDYSIYGWMQLDEPFYIIHPNLFKSIEFFFGATKVKSNDKEKTRTKLLNIIEYKVKTGQDGHEEPLTDEDRPEGEPFYGIGMIDFYNRFDEIMEYYRALYPKKEDYYQDIMSNREKIFTRSIPVFTTLLRPFDVIDGKKMNYEHVNGPYVMMNKLVYDINKSTTRFNKKIKPKNQLLYDLQMKYMELYKEIEDIISGKKGQMQNLLSGRFTFSSRCVITQDPSLRIDQVKLPYIELVIVLQQRIINILKRTYNISPSEAYDIWEKAQVKYNPRVADIIMSIIHSYPEGLPVLINRNPTIAYGLA